MCLVKTHQPPLDLGQDFMNSLTVPCVLLFGHADMDQAPILPGSMDKSAAVFRMDFLLVGLLRKGQSHSETIQRKVSRWNLHLCLTYTALSTQSHGKIIQLPLVQLNMYWDLDVMNDGQKDMHNPICVPDNISSRRHCMHTQTQT